MITINGITDGIVIDHIKTGLGIKIYNYLKLDDADFSAALIRNAVSNKCGRKDIIKIENAIDIDLIDLTVIGLIDSSVTINFIKDGRIEKKMSPELPEKVTDVIKCKNPRCITTVEKQLKNVFYLEDKETGEYRCMYCDETSKFTEV